MAKDPPPFARPDYWDQRFTKNPSAFDWLLPANCLDGVIVEALDHASSPSNPRPRLLHIGCGTSALSLHLRSHVDDPRQVHNTDFSRVAVELGAQWERDVFEPDAPTAREETGAPKQDDAATPPPDPVDETTAGAEGGREGAAENPADHHPPRMQWSTLDLLSLPSIAALAHRYDIVVDKSTCDAISCGDDVPVPLPYHIQPRSAPPPSASSPDPSSSSSPSPSPSSSNSSTTTATSSPSSPPSSMVTIHPLHILALHLALIVPPGGRWLALSYSPHRFPFFEPFPARVDEGRLDKELLERGFVHPGRLWRLERKEMVEVEEGEGDEDGGGRLVHRPKTAHWVYVLVREGVDVEVMGAGGGGNGVRA
ncbi:endothelin-converting enzyme 2-like protein [Diplodia corticola]|uniref:Endothelin-converting enzyme 2-like protein n=1 Tax=Diplodia corticola TaxID=236234 RepID=A0A1J9SB36_9PEZI|nr:endothelin-converting enzyme 2-like protein [Diplodia corticola]OJD37703.1 endothelin-converting enzyme 2-like protein [Diplodia corticola]